MTDPLLPAPHFSISIGGDLVLTIEPDQLAVCTNCPRLHVRVFPDATPDNLRRLAAAVGEWADRLEVERDY